MNRGLVEKCTPYRGLRGRIKLIKTEWTPGLCIVDFGPMDSI